MKIITPFMLLACTTGHVMAQEENHLPLRQGWSLQVQGGVVNLWSDLGGQKGAGAGYLKDLNMKSAGPVFGAAVTWDRYRWGGIKLELNAGVWQADDGLLKGVSPSDPAYGRYLRNLNVKAPFQEGLLLAEIRPFQFADRYHPLALTHWQPYVAVGAGLFHYNPTGLYTHPDGHTEWVDLQPLHTEGQGFAEYPDRKPYNLTQFSIPMQIGLRYHINENWALGVQFTYRKTFTDYLDDASTTYINPDLFAKYAGTDATVARAMSDKSYLLTADQQPIQHAGDMRASASSKDAYSSFTISVKYNLYRKHGLWD